MEQQGKIHGNKLRGKFDLNLENVTGNVITLEIAERELMYGWDICKEIKIRQFIAIFLFILAKSNVTSEFFLSVAFT